MYNKSKLELIKYNNYKIFNRSYIKYEDNGIWNKYKSINRLIYKSEYFKDKKKGKKIILTVR